MKHRLEYVAARTAIAVMRVLPHWMVLSIGSTLGLLVYVIDVPHRRIATGTSPSRSRPAVRGSAAGSRAARSSTSAGCFSSC